MPKWKSSQITMVVVSPSPQRIQAILNHLEITFVNCRFIYSKFDELGVPSGAAAGGSSTTASDGVNHQGNGQGESPGPSNGHEGNGNGSSSSPPPPHMLSRRRSTLASIQKWVHDTTSELLQHHNPLDCITGGRRSPFTDCVFPPSGAEQEVRDAVSGYEAEYKHCRFSFTHCIFVKRETTLLEDFIHWFKRLLGVRFELDFVTGAAKIEDKKCKLKDIPWIVELVTTQIGEDQEKVKEKPSTDRTCQSHSHPHPHLHQHHNQQSVN